MKILDEAISRIERKDLEALKTLLGKHPYVFHFEAPCGWPILHRCMAKPWQNPCVDLDLVKLFAANGGDTNQRTDSGLSLLFLATINSSCVKMGIPAFLAQCGGKMSSFEQAVATLMNAGDDTRRVKATIEKLLKDEPD